MRHCWSLPAVRTLSTMRACHAWTVRVLLVDDEERLVAALRRGLTAEGFVTESARDGPTGLDLARHGDFDAVVLDVMLPGLSGYEVVRRLRAEDNWVPVLMLSAKDGEYDQADGLDDGADDYLTKPFSFVVLLARIRALLRRGAVARPAVLTAGDLSLDPASREVRVGGRAGRADPAGVRPAGVPDPQRRPGGGQDRAARPRLGQRRRRHPERRRGLRRVPAAQARPRPAQTVRGVGYRLRPVNRFWRSACGPG